MFQKYLDERQGLAQVLVTPVTVLSRLQQILPPPGSSLHVLPACTAKTGRTASDGSQ